MQIPLVPILSIALSDIVNLTTLADNYTVNDLDGRTSIISLGAVAAAGLECS